MRVALLTDGIQPYVIGGMQRHSFFLAKYLAGNRIFVDLYHTWSGGNESQARQLEVFTSEEKEFIRSFLIPFPPPAKFPGHYLRRSYAFSEAVYECFRKNRDVDFIYLKGFAGWKLLEEKSRGGRFAPVGIKFHGMNMFRPISGIKQKLAQYFFRPKVKFLMNHSDYVFSYGGKISDIIRKAGVPGNKIIEMPTGIEKEWLSDRMPETGTVKKFLYVGRFDPVKGIRELYTAIKQVTGRYKCEFHFIGPFPNHAMLKHPAVCYHGVITKPEHIMAIMDSCDILVCPSYSEGMPNVILEAMSRGLAVLATDTGAVNILVDKHNGWLIESPSPRHIEQALTVAINASPAEINIMKVNSKTRIRQGFLWDRIAVQLAGKLMEMTAITNS